MTSLDDITKQAQESLALAEKATDGPWYADVQQPRCWVESAQGKICDIDSFTPPVPNCNEDFIAHARTALPDLAKAWLAVQEALEERGRVPGNVELAIIRAAILRRLSK